MSTYKNYNEQNGRHDCMNKTLKTLLQVIKISAGPEVKGVTPKLVGIEGKLVLHVLSIL